MTGRVAIHVRTRHQLQSLRSSKGNRWYILLPIFSWQVEPEKKAQALCRANPDALLFFYFNTQTISRVEPCARYNLEYLSKRTWLQDWLSGPNFVVRDNGICLEESWHSGTILALQNNDLKLKYVHKVIADLIAAVEHNSKKTALEVNLWQLDKDQFFFDQIDHFGLQKKDVVAIMSCMPILPSHGDLGCHNILVSGEQYKVIDWDYELVSLRPVWYDIMSLFEKDKFLRKAWANGEFDWQLHALSRSVGYNDCVELLRWVLPLAWSTTFCSKRPIPSDEGRALMRIKYTDQWRKSLAK